METCSLNGGTNYFNWLVLQGMCHPAKDQVLLFGSDEGNSYL